MSAQPTESWSRRKFLKGLTLAATAGFLGVQPELASGTQLPLETKTIRLLRSPSLCWAPQYIADELLRAEGFTDVTYGEFFEGAVSEFLTNGKADISVNFVGPNIVRVDQGDPVVFLAGIHVGCFEVFGTERVPRIRDLKGKKVGLSSGLNGGEHVFLASIAAYIGLDPRKDITWVVTPPDKSIQLFKEGKIDVILGYPPTPQRLRDEGIGRVLVNSAIDRPWSQYFCCLVTASREFVRRNPMATKAAVRAILKATDLCAQEPEHAAQRLVAEGYTPSYDRTLQIMRELPYGKWREYDPEDTLRFYSLNLHDAGMIKTSPNKLIAQSTDWRFLRELKKELKG